jgi:tRNA-specific 2-thiouridylase
MKVIVGMSGGVDSSMAAYLLKKQGYEVEGLSLILFETRGRKDPKSCCSLEAINDAAETAARIGISHRVINARDAFIEKVIEPFVLGYKRGITPNPCILCNRHIKFPVLLGEADASGAGFVATGHYARVGEGLLKTGVDGSKDQSYVLYALRKEEISRLILPLGDFLKTDVRKMARESGLPVFGRPESQEICFIAGKDYTPVIKELSPESVVPGHIINEEGKIIGAHKGIYAYTIGQRKGLGISSPYPLYVTKIDAGDNSVHVGRREAAMRREFEVFDLNWFIYKKDDFRAAVKVRSMMKAAPALIKIAKDCVRVIFDKPEWAPAPGQSAVFYEGDKVIGGGIIGEDGL